MKLNIYEIFDEVNKSATPAETLKKLHNPLVREMLKLNYCYSESFDLPEGEPPYKTNKMLPIGHSDTTLYAELRRLYIFFKSKDLAKGRKEQLFVHMLEGIHWTEGKVLIAIKDRKLEELFPNITLEVAKQVYPTLVTVEGPAKTKGEVKPKKDILAESGNASSNQEATKIQLGKEAANATTSQDAKVVVLNENGKPKNKGGRPKGAKNKSK